MKTLALLMVVAGCAPAGGDDTPVQPTHGPVLPVAGNSITGRVCVVTDPRNLGACSTTTAAGLAVTLAGAETTTGVDGTFSLPIPTAANAMLAVSGPGVMPTQMLTSSVNAIPVLKADLFSQMMAANGITLSSGSGSILGTVVRGGVPVSGITVTSTPSPAFGPLFDGSTPTAFQLNATGARGVVWVPGVTAGPVQLTFRDLASSGETTVDGVQVVDGGITIMDAVLP
jgi:hypothetical protein